MKHISLDFANTKTLWELHEQLKQAFRLPEYYGRNMDALWDCLHCSFEEQTTIILKNISGIPDDMQDEVGIMLELFNDLERGNPEVFIQTEDSEADPELSDYIV